MTKPSATSKTATPVGAAAKPADTKPVKTATQASARKAEGIPSAASVASGRSSPPIRTPETIPINATKVDSKIAYAW